MDQVAVLLKFLENWNMNSRTSYEAQLLLNLIIHTTSLDHWRSIPNISSILQTVIAYSGSVKYYNF
eukprot:m.70874 g.70874  ORF g.70874 m.70874 type:complete len:66 (-) comp8326_c0_seq3:65-262(-)